MIDKKILFAIFLVGILAVGAVNAADDGTGDIVGIDDSNDNDNMVGEVYSSQLASQNGNEGILKADVRSFADLNATINGNSNATINLYENYTYVDGDEIDGIEISRNVTIDGHGITIDGAKTARIFRITADNVTLRNINFINGKSNNGAGAILWSGNSGNLTNCNFTSNEVTMFNNGGAIRWSGKCGYLADCNFINNTAGGGAALFWTVTNGTVINCNFTGNEATNYDGGAVTWWSKYGYFAGCNFTGNKAKGSGGAIYFNSADYSNLINCTFDSNSAHKYAGAIYLVLSDYCNVTDCDFIDNSANDKGAALYWEGKWGSASGCSFVDDSDDMGGNFIHASNSFSLSDSTFKSNPIFNSNQENLYLILNLEADLFPYSIQNINNLSYWNGTAYADLSSGNIKLANQNVTLEIYDSNGVLVVDYSILTDNNGQIVYDYINLPAGDYTYNAYPNDFQVSVSGSFSTADFRFLQDYIDRTEEGGVVNLTRNFTYNNIYDENLKEGIRIDKAITINGNGAVIDGNCSARIFNIVSENVNIYNLTFVNANAAEGSSILANGGVVVSDCVFINNVDPYDNDIKWDDGKIYNSAFKHNTFMAGDERGLIVTLALEANLNYSNAVAGGYDGGNLSFWDGYRYVAAGAALPVWGTFGFSDKSVVLNIFNSSGDLVVDYSNLTDGNGQLAYDCLDLSYGDYTYVGYSDEYGVSASGSFVYNAGEFNLLQAYIDRTVEGGVLVLDRNFTFTEVSDDNLKNGIRIDKAITINGNGAVIDGNCSARIFNIVSENVNIYNLTFVNANAAEGSAILANGGVVVSDCVFINNVDPYDNDIKWDDGKIYNSAFKHNTFMVSDERGLIVTLALEANLNYSNAVAGGYDGSNLSFWDGYRYVTAGAALPDWGTVGLSDKRVALMIYNSSGDLVVDYSNLTDGNGQLAYDCLDLSYGDYTYVGYSVEYGVSASGSFVYNAGEFNLLQAYIDRTEEGGVLVLARNFTFTEVSDDNLKNGIRIVRPITINGNGAVIDGNCSARIFNIISDNVNIYNLTFVNGKADKGGAVYWDGNSGNLFNCNFLSNDAYERGGALYIDGDSCTLSNCNFTGNNASNDGGAVSWAGKYGNLTNCDFTGNNASNYRGGAVYWTGRSGNLTYCNFADNAAAIEGGAVYWANNAAYLAYCNFINNTANDGGAVYLYVLNSYLSYCNFTDNKASSGGAVYWYGKSGNLTYCNFISNSASNDGGAVYWYGRSGNLTYCNFTYNKASNGGGAVYWMGETGILTYCDFISNSASDGGAVNWMGETGILTYCDFISNSAINGGAVCWNASLATLTYCNFESNYVLGGGGAVFWIGSNGYLFYCNFTDNSAMWGGAVIWSGHYGHLRYCNFDSNAANVFRNGDGGAVYWTGVYGDLGYSNFSDNTADKRGGSIYWGRMSGSVYNCSFVDNLGGWVIDVIYSTDHLPVSNSTFRSNPTLSFTQKALYLVFTLESNINYENIFSGDIEKNNLRYWDGSAYVKEIPSSGTVKFVNQRINLKIFNSTGDLVVDCYNLTDDEGQIVYDCRDLLSGDYTYDAYHLENGFNISTSGSFNLNQGNFNLLRAYIDMTDEGGVLNLTRDFTFTEGLDDNLKDGIPINKAITINGNGAVIDANHSARIFNVGADNVVINNITFINGNAENGGAIYFALSGTVTNCNFTNNSASSNGGAIYKGSAINCTFINNTAYRGAALSDGGAYNCSFINNNARQDGGAVFKSNAYDCTFKGNTARWGGAFYENEAHNCDFVNNTASEQGGAIFNGKADNCNFTENHASNDGGAVYSNIHWSYLTNCIFVDNEASNDGGAVYWRGNEGNLVNCNFTDNGASNHGDAVYLGGYYNSISGCSFVDNSGKWTGEFIATSRSFSVYDSNFTRNPTLRSSNSYFYLLVSLEPNLFSGSVMVSNSRYFYDSYWVDVTDSGNVKIPNQYVTLEIYDSAGDLIDVYSNFTDDNGQFVYDYINLPFGYYTYNAYHNKSNSSVSGSFNTGEFILLQAYIYRTSENGVLNLTRDFTFAEGFDDNLKDGIRIDKPITINGNGAVIDGNHLARIFNVAADNVTINNITFVNGNAGNGGAIYWGGKSGNLTNCIFVDNDASNDGGAVCWRGNNGNLANCNFTDNAGKYGGALNLNGNSGNLTNCSFVSNIAYQEGGAIYMGGYSDYLAYCYFTDNGASTRGGAIYCTGSSGYLTYCNFTDNTASNDGGAVFWTGRLGHLTYCDFADNVATWGGAVYLTGESGYLTYCNFTDNWASNDGDAVYWNGDGGSVSGGNFVDNSDEWTGEFIFTAKSLSVSDSSFKCEPTLMGIDYGLCLTLTLQANLFSGPTESANLSYWGGLSYVNVIPNLGTVNIPNQYVNLKIYDSSGDLVVYYSNLTNDDGQLVYDYMDLPRGYYNYDAYYLYDESVIFTSGSFGMGDFNILQAYINRASENGVVNLTSNFTFTEGWDDNLKDGIRIDKPITINGNGAVIDANCLARIFNVCADNVTINNITFVNGMADNGGAIYWNGLNGSLFDSTFKCKPTLNCSNRDLYLTFTLEFNLFSGPIESANLSYWNGTTYVNEVPDSGTVKLVNQNVTLEIYDSAGDLVFVYSNFTDNDGQIAYDCMDFAGGNYTYGAYSNEFDVSVSGSFAIGDFNILQCCIDRTVEGGVLNLTRNFTFTEGLDDNLKSGILIGKSITINGNGAVIDANYSARIFKVDAKNVVINNITFINGNAFYSGLHGGAIYFEDYGGTVTNCNFTNNRANPHSIFSQGGAIFFYRSGTVTNCNFTNNSAIQAAGAISFHSSGTVINCNFTNNSADGYGGAIYQGPAINCTFTGNHANSGGAIYEGSAIDCTFNGNHANGGGAMYEGAATNCKFIENSADGYGGAIDGYNHKSINCTFIGNSAGNNGGALSGGEAYNCSFISNTASQNGGAINNGKVDNSNFTENQAGQDGGAVFLDNNNVYLTYCNFTDNTASNHGDAVYWRGNDGSVSDCNFIDNSDAHPGEFIFSERSLSVSDSTFKCKPTLIGKDLCLTLVLQTNLFSESIESTRLTYWNGLSYVNVSSGSVKIPNQNVTLRIYNSAGDLVVDFSNLTDDEGKIVYDCTDLYCGNYTYRAHCLYDESVISTFGSFALNSDDFNLLQAYINRASENGVVNLTSNFTFTEGWDENFKEGILIDKPITINGNGAVIDANHFARIFNVAADDVTITNVTFVNGNAWDGGAIYWNGKNGHVDNCIFVNNAAENSAGAIFANENIMVSNCAFIDNIAPNNNDIKWSMGQIYNSTFKHSTFLNADFKYLYLTLVLKYDLNYANAITGDYNGGNLSFWDGYEYVSVDDVLPDWGTILFPHQNITLEIYDSAGDLVVYYSNLTDDDGQLVYDCINLPTGYYTYVAYPNKFNSSISGSFGIGDFNILQAYIDRTVSGGVLNLTRNFTFTEGWDDNLKDGISIGKAITINGNGAVIDANKSARIFYFNSDFIVINNITFINGNAGDGGAIYWHCWYNNVINCNFVDNGASDGGAIYWHAYYGNVINCNFTNNSASDGGAVSLNWADCGQIVNCNFDSNTAFNYGGAIKGLWSDYFTISNCNFTDNGAINGGGAIVWWGDDEFNMGINAVVSNCNFEDNAANEGGAVYFRADNGNIVDCNFTRNVANRGGAMFWGNIYDLGKYGTISGCYFNGNNATWGGAICWNPREGKIINSTFINNKADSSSLEFADKYPSLTLTFKGNEDYGNAIRLDNGNLAFRKVSYWNGEMITKSNLLKSNLEAGQNITIEIYDKSTGELVDCVHCVTDLKGKVNFDYTYLPDGEYAFVAYHPDDSYYSYIETTGNFVLNRVKTNMTIAVGNITHGEYPVINVTADLVGNYSILIDDKTYATVEFSPDDVLNHAVKEITIGDVLDPKSGYVASIHFRGDWVYSTQTCQATFDVMPDVRLAVVKSSGVEVVGNNSLVNYTITVVNNGLSNASNIWVNDTLIDGLEFVNASEGFVRIGDSIIWKVDLAGSGETLSYWIVAKTTVPAILDNVVNVCCDENETVVTAKATVNVVLVNLTVIKSSNVTDVSVGDSIKFTIDVVNTGIINATDIYINDLIDTGIFDVVEIGNQSLRDLNGNVAWLIPRLDVGDSISVFVTLRAKVNGTYNNTATVKSREGDEIISTVAISVSKIPVRIVVGNLTTYSGLNAYIPINVTPEDSKLFNGNVTIYLPDGASQSVEIINGYGCYEHFVSYEYAPDVYNVTVKLADDVMFEDASGYGTITVIAIPSSIKAENASFTYGEVVVIPVSYVNASGFDYVVFNDSFILKGSTAGDIIIFELGAGNYFVNMTTIVDKNHASSTIQTLLTVNKASSSLDVNGTVLYFGDDAVLDYAAVNATGLNISIPSLKEGIDYNLTITDSQIIISGLAAGNYSVNVTALADDNHVGSSKEVSVVVIAMAVLEVEKTVSVTSAYVGDIITYTISVKNNGPNNATDVKISDMLSDLVELVNATLDGERIDFTGEYVIPVIENGQSKVITLSVKALGEGFLENTVSVNGREYGSNGSSSAMVVEIKESIVFISAPDLVKYYSGSERFVVNLTYAKGSPAANKAVNITINGVTYPRTTDENGMASLNINLGAGKYDVTVKADDVTEYSVVTVLSTINASDVESKNKNLLFTATFIDGEGNPLTDGTPVTFNIKGVIYNSTVKGGKGSASIDLTLDRGRYIITSYNPVSGENASNNIAVDLKDADMILSDDEITVGENATIGVTLPSDAAGNVTASVNGKSYSSKVNDGKANIIIPGLSAGNYTIPVTYLGDDKYNSASGEANVTVNKANAAMTIDAPAITEGENATVTVSLASDATGSVTIGNVSVPVKDGTASAVLTDLPVGTNTVPVTYSGDDKYNPIETSADIIVNEKPVPAKENLTIRATADEITEGENATVIIIGLENATGNVSASVNGKTYTAPIEDSQATITVPGLSENATAAINYPGDDKYNPVMTTVNITVNRNTVTINAENLTKFYKDSEKFTVTVTDAKGQVAPNKTVDITINGVTYKRTTDDNGTASLNINLGAGEYPVSVAVDDVVVNSTVIVKSTIDASDVVKMFRNDTQYYARFTDANGNILPNTNVFFNINGVIYNRTTDANGTAKMNINMAAGDYIVTATNPVTGEMKSNSIKVISLIESDDLTKYYKNASQFVVRIHSADGAYVGAGEEVRFNINGVFYTRTTNATGHAKLNINLPQGNYTITTYYKNCSQGNEIAVLPVLSADDLVMKYRDGSQFKAKLVDGQGKAYAGQSVQFNINGVLYNRVTGSDGVAKLNINLMAGQYIITSSYNGFNTANKITIRG